MLCCIVECACGIQRHHCCRRQNIGKAEEGVERHILSLPSLADNKNHSVARLQTKTSTVHLTNVTRCNERIGGVMCRGNAVRPVTKSLSKKSMLQA